MKPVSFHPEATEEMLHAAQYYEQQQCDLGKRFVDAIQTSVRHIQINPHLYPEVMPGIRRSLTRTFPFGVIFRVMPAEIQVLAIAHNKREPHYWRAR